ncbi:MAG TPA: glycoside hydrolase family 13 protein [Candidatus Limnocylindrales bacterium]|nr:glycoside hydrolase family 13 protein [Candidatus Limnocylindrales bacterium]
MPIETPDWVRDAVFYQIFPDRFARSERVPKPGDLEPWDSPPTVHGFKGGDLLGVAERLDYLAELGITALYFNPVFQSASNHRYHTYDYFAVDPLLGGDAALRELIDAAHARGMRVVLDGVFNHASRGFWPFHHVMETGAASPYRRWFHFDQEALDAGRPVRAYPLDPQALDTANVPDEQRAGAGSLTALGYRAWWDLPALPKMNTDNPEVREYLFTVGEHWMRFGADGWRLDVALEISDESFWREFRRRVKAVNPEAYIVAEVWHEDPRYLQGDQFDAYMNYPLAASITSFTGASHLDRRVLHQHFGLDSTIFPIDGAEFARRVEHSLALYDPAVVAVQLNLLDTHDTPRFLAMCSGDQDSLRLATLLQMTLPGAPSIYYGDEIGMTGEQDPGCRAAFPWDRRDAWDEGLLAFNRGAIAARHANPVLRRGAYRTVAAWGAAMAFVRTPEAGVPGPAVVVAINAGDATVPLDLAIPELDGRRLVALTWPGMAAGPDGGVAVRDGRAAVSVPPRAGLILRSEIG